jgi:hypothetical protein
VINESAVAIRRSGRATANPELFGPEIGLVEVKNLVYF